MARRWAACCRSSRPRPRRTRPRSAKRRARLWRRSKPIVEEVLRSIPELPQSEPPRWPGPDLGLLGQRQQPLVQGAEDVGGALARLDREVGTGDVADEEAVAAQHRPGVAAAGRRRGAGRRCARDGGRGCGSPRCSTPSPSASVQPSAKGSCGYSASASSWTWIVAPLARARRPWPETWSAWLWVSSTCSIRTPCRRARLQVGVDVPLRVDHRGDAGGAVADQVGGAAEVLVDDLAEEQFGLSVAGNRRRGSVRRIRVAAREGAQMGVEENTDLERRLASCSRSSASSRPAEFRERALLVRPGRLRGGGRRPGGLVAAPGDRAARLGRGAERGPRRLQPALLQVVRRRQAERLRQLPRPPRRGRATASGSPSTGAARRARSATSPTPSCSPTIQRFANALARPRRREGRRRRDLPADDPRGRGRDARLRPDRRRPQRRLRRLLGRGGAGADGVLRGQGAGHRRRRPPQGQDGADQAGGRRADGRPGRAWRRSSSSATPASSARCARAATSSTTRCSEAAAAECPAEPMDAEHPLFILYTSGSTAKPKGILHTTGGYLTGVADHPPLRLRPEARGGRLLVRRRRRLDHRPLLHRLRPARQRRHQRDVGGGARLSRARASGGSWSSATG